VVVAVGLLSMLASGCSEASPTRLHLVVTAGPAVHARMTSVRLRVIGGSAPDSTEIAETRASDVIEWPAEAWIVPRDGDASRAVRIEVDALGPSGQTIARVATSTTFVARETRLVHLHLDDGCLDAATCEVILPCAGSECDDAGAARPSADAGAPRPTADAGRRPHTDAAASRPRDAGAPVDAPRCESAEECNARDDDCDGRTDEDLVRRCGRLGLCWQRCEDGDWGSCDGLCHDDDDDDRDEDVDERED
jgi:hypothetical protein